MIVLACSLNDRTRGFADAGFFRRVKEDAVFVNVARGALVDDAALIDCLDSGRLRRAVLDVFAGGAPRSRKSLLEPSPRAG